MSSMPPSAPQPASPLSQSEERTWSLIAHLSGIVLSVIGPLIILLVYGPRSAFVKDQATEALNFQITVLIASIVSGVLMLVLIGFILLPIVIVVALVFMVIAAVRANEGVAYRYPINIRLVK